MSSPNTFITANPPSFSYPSCTLSTSYSTTILLTSHLNTPTPLTLTAPISARRNYAITPNTVTLPPQSPSKTTSPGTPITIKVTLQSLSSTDIRNNTIRDHLTLTGSYFTQRIPIVIQLKSPPSPSRPHPTTVPITSDDNKVEQLMKRVETLTTHTSKLQTTVQQQSGENEHLRSMLAGVDTEQSAARTNTEAVLSRERAVFEERSAKVLTILNRRDEKIEGLSGEIERLIERNSQVKAKGDVERAGQMQEIERLQDRVIELSKRQRQSDVNTLEAITNGVSGSMQSGNLDDTLTMEYSNKLKLKEEQIEVLVAEVMSLRASQHHSDSDAVKQLETARGRNAAMEQELEGRRRENETLKLQYDQQQMLQQQLHDPELAAATNDELQTFDQTSKMIDMEVLIARLKATVADKTRQAEDSIRSSKAAQEREEMAVADYKAMAEKVRHQADANWESKFRKVSEQLEHQTTEYARLTDLYDTAKSVVATTDARLQEALHMLDDKKRGKRGKPKRGGENTWWRHVSAAAKTLPPSSSGNAKTPSSHPRTDNLTTLGVTITTLRQSLLKAELTHRHEADESTELLRASTVRVTTLESHLRTGRDANTVRVRELESALRVVSGRSDLHATLASSQQQLASERVKMATVQGDLKLHVDLLEEARHNLTLTTERLGTTSEELDMMKVVRTLEGVPGVDPAEIIDGFVGQLEAKDSEIEEMRKTWKKKKRRPTHNKENSNTSSNPNPAASSPPPPPDDSDSDSDSESEEEFPASSSPLSSIPESRLTAQVTALTAQMEALAVELAAEKQRYLESDRDKDALITESSLSYKRTISKLERKLATTVAEATSLRSDISSLRSDKLSTEELVRQLNYNLETTKQHLSVQTKLANTNVSFASTYSEPSPTSSSELSRLQSLLDERTNNVAVLMQTIETLQSAINSSSMEDSSADDTATCADDSIMSGNTNHTSSAASSFAHSALSKRVISLTAELSSATAVAAMMERRADQMGLEVQQRSKYSNFLAAKLKLYEDENKKHDMRAGIVADEHNRLMNTFNRELSRTTNQNNDLRRTLAATETSCKDSEIEQTALSSDIVVLEDTVHGLRKKLREETADPSSNTSNSNSPSANSKATPLALTDQLRITSIVENFTDQLQQLRGSSKPNRRTKQQDDQIFAWVVDVVIKTDSQMLDLARERNELQKELRKTIIERDSMDLSLEEAHQREAHFEKRLELCEAALASRATLKLTQTENSLAAMESRVREAQDELVALSEKDLYICAEHRSTVQQLVNATAGLSKAEAQKISLQAELKCASSKARTQAGLELDDKIADSETKIRQWFDSELAALVSGRAGKGKQWNDFDKYDDELVAANEAAASLAQALATAKQVQHGLELKLGVTLDRCDSSSEQIGVLQQSLHDVVSASSTHGNGEEAGFMSRLWELYAPTGTKTHTSPAGEPNPTFQNLIAEVDTLRAKVKEADHEVATSSKEQERLNVWLGEARKDAENAQEQLSKRTNAIRGELEKRHSREVTLLQQQREEQHSAQIGALGQLRSELLNKETALNEAKLRLQLFGDNGSETVQVSNMNTGEISYHPPIVQQNALQQERDFLLQKNDSLVEELRVCSGEKFDLENECERLVGAAASYQAEVTHVGEELNIHRHALRGLEESVGGAVKASQGVGSDGGEGEISSSVLSRSLASAKLAEAAALQKLQKSSQNEVSLRVKIEEKEREVKELKRLVNGEGKGDGKQFSEEVRKAVDLDSESPWAEENVTKLRQRVSTQASAIAYLELRIAQLMAEQSVAVGDSGLQNLQRELNELREDKARVETELIEVRGQMEVRGKLALSVLDSNTTRLEGDREVKQLQKLDDERGVREQEREREVGELRGDMYGVSTEKKNLVAMLDEKSKEVETLREAAKANKKEHAALFAELRESSERLLKFGGGRVKDYVKEGADVSFELDVENVKKRPLFVAANKLHDELSTWLEQWQGGAGVGDVIKWDDLWELTKVASETRELAAVAEELPLSLQVGMNELRSRVLDLHSEMEEREDRVTEVAETVVRDKSVEAIQQLRAQVMLLKKRAEEGEGVRKEVTAENDLLKRESTKHHEELVSLRSELLKKKVEAEEELSGLRGELVKLRKSSWEQTSGLRSKYEAALSEVEASCEKQVGVAEGEVKRLEELLQEASEKGRISAVAFGDYLQGGAKQVAEKVAVGMKGGAEGGEAAKAGEASKVKKLQMLLDKAASEAQLSAKALRDMEGSMLKGTEKHDEQVVTLREQFGRYREAQDKLVAGLHSQLREFKAGGGGGGKVPFSRSMARIRKEGTSSDNDEIMAVLALKESSIVGLEQRVKKLSYEYKVKAEEAEAARKAAFEVTSGADKMVGVSVIERAILEAKGGVVELELKRVMGELREEKEEGAGLRRELAAAVLQVASVRSSGAGSAGQPKVQSVLKQLGEVKRKAKMEIGNLRGELSKFKGLKETGVEVVGLKKKMEGLGEALGLAREDLSRKNKIILNLRNSRSADEKAVAQWKSEVEVLEDKYGKSVRELNRREGLLRDMKNKQALFEEGGGGGGGGGGEESGAGGGDGGDKMREMNLERNRFRQQVTILRSKVAAQSEEIELLGAERDRVKGLESKIAALKASIGRKDSILGALKNQVQGAEDEFKLYKKSADESGAGNLRKIRELEVRVREGEGKGATGKEEGEMRIKVLEGKKESLQDELATIKGSMYSIMGDLYSANQKARGSPGMAGEGGVVVGGGMGALDAERLSQISSMLDLSSNEMQDIFDVGGGGAVGGGGGGGEMEGGGERERFLGTLEEALDLSGEKQSVDVAAVMSMGKSLVSAIERAREEL